MKEFRNEPHIDWSRKENISEMEKALREVRRQFGRVYPAVIGGKEYTAKRKLVSFDPAFNSFQAGWEINCPNVGESFISDDTLVNKALQSALLAFSLWRHEPISKRAEILKKVANTIRERKFFIAAWLVYEVSKTWDEAIAEVEEAIDFVNLYTEAASEYSELSFQPFIRAEKNFGKFVPRGITAAISTWNFPFALSVEKIVASLVAGCPVLFKPAEQAFVIGWEVVRCFLDAGVPQELIAYLPGDGETGALLVKSPFVNQISFTGSKEVGLRILRVAQQTPGFDGPKRVDVEMGGNNASLVFESAIRDMAIADWIKSKFGFNGQKCSALQRGIIVGSPKNRWVREFISRLGEAAESLNMGHPQFSENSCTGLIDLDAYNRMREKMVMLVKTLGKESVICGGDDFPEMEGWFINPTIFQVSPEQMLRHPLIKEEIFGPVLFVCRVDDFESAIKLANSSDAALTAGIHTESKTEIDCFLESIQAGNIYVNRTITGALVGRQPFGGYKYSGLGDKVGSVHRLRFFMNEVSVSINLERHGMILT